jgi:predicted aconitase
MYLDLFQTYDKLIQQSVPVYVSTSYLTADKRFEQDYLRLLDRYDMEIVTDGCLHTCAVYRLQIKVNKE